MEGKTREAPNEQYYLDVFAKSIAEISHSLSEISQSLKEITQVSVPAQATLSVQATEETQPTEKEKPVSQPITRDRYATQRSEQFILSYLADGRHLFTEVLEAAIKAGCHRTAVYGARTILCKEGKIAVWKEKTPNGLKPFMGLAGTEPFGSEGKKVKDSEKIKPDWYAGKPKGFKEWDILTYELAYQIVRLSPKDKYKTASSVYKEVFDQMTKQYGICWAQMGKEAKASLSRDRVPPKKEVCYMDDNTKSIFLAKLEDMYANLSGKTTLEIANTCYVIQPEKGKYENRPKMSVQDLTRAYLIDLDKNPKDWNKQLNLVYAAMDINWDTEREKYDDRHHTKTYSLRRTRLIEDDDNLYLEFCKTLDEMYDKNTSTVKTA